MAVGALPRNVLGELTTLPQTPWQLAPVVLAPYDLRHRLSRIAMPKLLSPYGLCLEV